MSMQDLTARPIHLGKNGVAMAEPAFTGDSAWYAAYVDRRAADGPEGRLVSYHRFEEDWDNWEMHPEGFEVVLCVKGEITLIQEGENGAQRRLTLNPLEYAINPPGVWHTADIADAAAAVFITSGWGTQHRPRRS